MFTESKITFAVALALALFMDVGVAEAQPTKGHQPRSTEPLQLGRWQIVNGTPEMTRNIMLLDTSTGESWILSNSGRARWSFLKRQISPEELAARMNGPKRPSTISPPGGWQIVNGTPKVTMLLNTSTGESWILCDLPSGSQPVATPHDNRPSSEEVTTQWCNLEHVAQAPSSTMSDALVPVTHP